MSSEEEAPNMSSEVWLAAPGDYYRLWGRGMIKVLGPGIR